MVISCWVKGCSNRADGNQKRSFYNIPAIRQYEGEQTMKLSEERRRLWLANIGRKDVPSKYSKICSDHFIKGKPSDLYNRTNPDWAPTLKLNDTTPTKSTKKIKQVDTDYKRYNRAKEREKMKEKCHAARALLDLQFNPVPEPELTPLPQNPCLFLMKGRTEPFQALKKSVKPVTEKAMQEEIQRLLCENQLLKSQLNEFKMSQDSFFKNDDKVKFYTGLPNYLTIMTVFSFIEPFIPKPRKEDLGKFERVIMTLMRLKINATIQDLAYRFQTSTSTVSRIFLTVIHVLFVRLKHILYWPDREELQKTMPLDFRKHFGKKTAVVIDCFEVFIQRPKNLLARAQTWSSYKHHNTVKFLIGITPQGSVSFLSKAWDGRASDKFITENCGILQKLLPGDLILADRGFDISDSVGMYCAQVNIPSFMKGRAQLSPLDLESTRKIAVVRIQVERVIGLVRNKYTMLQDALPVDYLMNEEGETPVIDKIATVSCALCNMCESVVSFN